MSFELESPFISNPGDDLEEKPQNYFSSKKILFIIGGLVIISIIIIIIFLLVDSGDSTINEDNEYEFLLSENLVKVYYNDDNQDEIVMQTNKYMTLIDFESNTFKENISEEYSKISQKSFKWQFKNETICFKVPQDLSEYDAVEFWIYIPENSVGGTFYIYFVSNDENNSYGKLIKLEKNGWIKINIIFNDLDIIGNPKGFNNISNLILSNVNFNQNNKKDTIIYLDNIRLLTIPELHRGRKDRILDLSIEKKNQTTTNEKNVSFYQWNYTTATLKFNVPQNLSEYEAFSFEIIAPESAINQTFYMYFSSENKTSEGIDYYGKSIKIENIYTKFIILKKNFGTVRQPLGWDNINYLVLTSNGWGQSNSNTTYFSISDIFGYTNSKYLIVNSNIPKIEGALFYLNGSRAIIKNELVNCGLFNDEKSKVFFKNNDYWLSLNAFGARYDNTSSFNKKTKEIKMKIDKNNYVFKGNDNFYFTNNKKNKIDFKFEIIGNSLFAPSKFIREIFKYSYIFTEEMGLIYLSKKEEKFNDLDLKLKLIYETVFLRPKSAEIISKMINYSGEDIHPRVMLRQEDFNKLKTYLATDEIFKSFFNRMINQYGTNSKEFKSAPIDYNLTDGVRLLAKSRQAKNRMIPWALIYKLTGNISFAERLWDDIHALCTFPDWHPAHYLDTAEILYAMALSYDWLYDYWSLERKKEMENATLIFGLMTGLERYQKSSNAFGTNNWNGVCNGGLVSASLAYLNSPKIYETAKKILEYSLADVENGMFTYAPDGGYLESPGYWSYGTNYLQILFSSLESCTGTTFGLFYSPGFAKSAYFTTYFENNAGCWGFHDSGSGQSDTTPLFWFAKKTNDSSLGFLRYNSIFKKYKYSNFHDIMFYEAELVGKKVNLKLDAFYSNVGAMTMRSSWDDGAILIGLHGGYNKASHGDLDIGNFIIFGAGKQFIIDLGSDNYNLPYYFGYKRYYYYRKRAEGQNTLVIGDVNYTIPDQISTATGKFLRTESNEKSAISVVDLSTAYENVISGYRGIWFKNNRTTIILQDEILLNNTEIVRWAVHIKGTIKINGKVANISMSGCSQYLLAEIYSEDNSLEFQIGLANSYDVNYPKEFDSVQKEYNRSDIKKLMIITKNKVSKFNLAVAFKFVNNNETAPKEGKLYTWKNIQDWNLE